MLQCPNCKHNLKTIDHKGLKINECENCSGKWFDRDELRRAKDSTDDNLRWLDFDLFAETANKYNIVASSKKCPREFSEMTSLTYMDSKVVIDKCNSCQGVWLDNEEFEKIIKYLENIVVTKPASDYAKEAIKEFSEILNGPEKRISEIKDFLAVMKMFEFRLAIENHWIITLSENINKYWPIR